MYSWQHRGTGTLSCRQPRHFSNHGSVERPKACFRHKYVFNFFNFCWVFQKFPFFCVSLYITFCRWINWNCTASLKKYNEIYLLINYVKSVLWRVAERLSYIQDARCLKVKLKAGAQMDVHHSPQAASSLTEDKTSQTQRQFSHTNLYCGQKRPSFHNSPSST